MLGPVGVLSILHEDAELAVARAAARTGVPMCLSTAASSTMEDVAGELGETPGWYQLYWPNDTRSWPSRWCAAPRPPATAPSWSRWTRA